LSIAYLGTFLHRRNLSFDYVNSFNLEKDKLEDLLLTKEIHTIAIPTTLYTHYYPIQEIVQYVRKYNQSAKIIIGGPFVGNRIKEDSRIALSYFNRIGGDIYVYSSQGEAALVNVINTLKNKGDLRKVDNLFFKENNEFIATDIVAENNYLGDNMVDWQLFKGNLSELVNVRSAISCPFSCKFCGFPERAGKYYSVSVEEFEKELNSLRDTNVKSVYIIDDTFNIPQTRFKEVLKMMIKNKYPFKWSSYYRVQFAEREMLDLMVEAGCEGINLGLESGNQQILDNMNKKVTLDQYRKGLDLIGEYDFLKMATFILGFPGETEQSAKETVNFIKESGLDYYNYMLWFCDPITPIYREKEQYNIEGAQFNWSHSTMNSKTALDLLEDAFQSIKNPTWLGTLPLSDRMPFALHHRQQMGFDQIKNVIKSFFEGIAEKQKKTGRQDKNISPEKFEQFRSAVLSHQ
jgi:radical SAM PhpK family P-methyltransferase